MYKTYCADDFMTTTTDTLNTVIDKKIGLLYEMCALTTRGRRPDPREDAVRRLLEQCQSDIQIENLLYGVVRYECTINQLLNKKRVLM